MSNPSADTNSDEDHRDDTFELDATRWEQLMQMTRTAMSRDNRKQIAKLLAKKDRKMSSVAIERMRALSASMQEFRYMFHDKPAEVQSQLHYQEALVEILRQAGDQTGSWKLVLSESVNPFTGKLVIETLSMWGLQLRETAFFHKRADLIAAQLREKFEEANPPVKLSEEEDSDHEDEPPNPENGSKDHRDDKNGSPKIHQDPVDPDFPDLSDNSFYSLIQKPSCNLLADGANPDSNNLESDLLNYEPQGPSYPPNTPELRLSPMVEPLAQPVVLPLTDMLRPSTLTHDRKDPLSNKDQRGILKSPSLTPKRPSTLTSNPEMGAMITRENDRSLLSPPSLTEINPSTSSPVRCVTNHRDENVVDRSINQIDQEVNFHNRVNRLFKENDRRRHSDIRAAERLTRDREGAARYLQNSIMSTRSHELSTAQSWGRQGAMQREPRGQVKRGSSVNYPIPKRSRSSQVERMRAMSDQFAQCLHLYQAMDEEMRSFQQFQPVGGDPKGLRRNCKHCTRFAGIKINHVGPFGGRGKYCIFDQNGRQRRPICAPDEGSPNRIN